MCYFCPCWTCRLLTRCCGTEDQKADDTRTPLDFLGKKAESWESSCPVSWATVDGIVASVGESVELERRREKIRAGEMSSREGRKDFKTEQRGRECFEWVEGLAMAAGWVQLQRVGTKLKAEPEEICTRLWGSMQIISERQHYRDKGPSLHRPLW